jgi:oligoendopeptidase F
MTQRITDTTYAKGRWSLDDLVPAKSGPELERVFEEVEAAAAAVELRRAALVPEIGETTFAEVLGLVEKLAYASQRLDGYAILRFFADTQDQDALALRARAEKTLAAARNRALSFELWWKALDDANAKRLLGVAGDNAYYLEKLRLSSPYTLSEAEEKIVNVKNVNGVDGLVSLYTMITNGFTYSFHVDGKTKTLTRSELMGYTRDASPERREAAYRALLGAYETRSGELAQIYKCIAGNWDDENIDLRGASSPISVRNLDNDIPDEVVDVLLETCRDNAGLYQRFFRLKAQWLGLPKLRRFDLLAPLDRTEAKVPFAEGVALVLTAFRAFSPRMAALAQRVLAEGHLDSSLRPGKRGGGVSWDALPGITPWVLVNYSDRDDDVATLAHELGHAVHAMMAADHSVLTFSPSLPMAETASNFASMLLVEHMLDRADPKQRRTLLARYVEDSYSAILRPAFAVLFEREAHRMTAEGATSDELSAVYMENLRAQFGDSVAVDDAFQHEWLSISHFYTTPFYDYAYAFGLLLVLGLYQRYKAEGEAFVPNSLKILAYGGSKAPIAVLDEAGFDIRRHEFWQDGFDILAAMVDELESLTRSLAEPNGLPPGSCNPRVIHLDPSHLPAYAELVAFLQSEEPSAVLERLEGQIRDGALDLADVFVTLDPTGDFVTGVLRIVRIGKDEAFLTQWRGREGGGTRRAIAGLVLEARARADELGIRDLSTRVVDSRMTEDYRDALHDAGFALTNRRVEYRTPLSQMGHEGVSSLAWKTMADTGEGPVLEMLREASIGTPDGVDTSIGSTAIENLLDGSYASMDPRAVQIGYSGERAVAVLFCLVDTESGWSTIAFMGLVPSHRGRGLGTQVHLHGIETLRALGGITYHDGTGESNETMQRLFAKQGCIESDRMGEWHIAPRPS